MIIFYQILFVFSKFGLNYVYLKKHIPFLLICTMFFSASVFSQAEFNKATINTLDVGTYASISHKVGFYNDHKKTEVDSFWKHQQFTSADDYLKTIKSRLNLVEHYSYLKIWVSNEKKIADTLFFYAGSILKSVEIFEIDSSKTALKSIALNNNPIDFIPLIFNATSSKEILVKLKFAKCGANELSPHFIRKNNVEFFKKNLYNKKSNINTFSLVLSGLLVMMILFTATNYILSKKKEFLYYCLYTISVFGIVFFNAALYKHSEYFSVLFWEYLDFCFLLIGSIFYIEFGRRFLNTKKNYSRADKLFRVEQLFLLLIFIIFSFIYFWGNSVKLQVLIENIVKALLLAFGVFIIVLAFIQKERLIKYLAIGNGLSILFWIVSLALILKNVPVSSIYNSAFVYYEVGLVTALIAFLFGLTYKNRQEIIETTKREEALKLEATKQKYETEIAIYKAQQEERNRISADMHDDLGAGMTSIRLYSELAKNKLADKDLTELNKISSSADELLGKMNAIIWSMVSSNDTLENMIAYLRSYAIEYFEDTAIKCTIHLPEQIPEATVSGFIRRNVFLVVKEALNNILKHANATEVTLTLQAEGKIVKVFIQDNGKGIDLNNLRQFSNGLKNMKKRMDDVDFDFKIENNNGTLITLVREIKD